MTGTLPAARFCVNPANVGRLREPADREGDSGGRQLP
jgi:hypothetical protein